MLQANNFKQILVGVLLFPLLSGLLMLLGWPPNRMFLLLFVGLVPLFFSVDLLKNSGGKRAYLLFFIGQFIAHLLWVAVSMKWLASTSPQSYLTGIIIESTVLALALTPTMWFAKHWRKNARFFFFAAAWMSVEYLNQHWMFGTPYFALGSGFGMHPSWVQHYEFIGIEGGSLWVLGVNYLMYRAIVCFQQRSGWFKATSIAFVALVFPMVVSLFIYNAETSGEVKRVAVLHAFVKPNQQEFTDFPEHMTAQLFRNSLAALKTESELIVWPEVIVNNLGWLSNITQEKAFVSVYKALEKYPNTTVCTGGYGFSVAPRELHDDPYTSFDSTYNYYYLTHNIALSISYGERAPIRSKSVFVPFQERIPMLKEFPFMENLADMVGSNSKISYYPNGVEIHKTKSGWFYAPILCYESIFPLEMARKANDAELISISANEYWNTDLSGSEQYLYNNVLMAIQSRTPIAKSSNSGASGIIDKKGTILQKRVGRDTGILIQDVALKDRSTLYTSLAGSFYFIAILTFVLGAGFALFQFFKRFTSQ